MPRSTFQARVHSAVHGPLGLACLLCQEGKRRHHQQRPVAAVHPQAASRRLLDSGTSAHARHSCLQRPGHCSPIPAFGWNPLEWCMYPKAPGIIWPSKWISVQAYLRKVQVQFPKNPHYTVGSQATFPARTATACTVWACPGISTTRSPRPT